MQGEQISVIIPMYNAQGQIRKCVDSLLAQTYKDFEIVLVNDGSKDNSLVMCKDAYGSDPRVKMRETQGCGPHPETMSPLSMRTTGWNPLFLPACMKNLFKATQMSASWITK